jgi:hypothetical protein
MEGYSIRAWRAETVGYRTDYYGRRTPTIRRRKIDPASVPAEIMAKAIGNVRARGCEETYPGPGFAYCIQVCNA